MIRVDVRLPIGFTEQTMRDMCAKRLGRKIEPSASLRLYRLAIDTSDKQNIEYKAAILLSLDEKSETFLIGRRRAAAYCEAPFVLPKASIPSRPVIVGFGPCGLFAALILAKCGACPIVLERGGDVDSRVRAVQAFDNGGPLDTENNIQFGEGGAGSFSDGKLKSGAVTAEKWEILKTLVEAGAPERILYDVEAHVGTDLLRNIVKRIRQQITDLGGTVLFGAKMDDIIIKHGAVCGVRYIKDGITSELACSDLLLATGHSARDTFRMLSAHGIAMEARGFGIGVRVEHPREYIDRMVYGDNMPKELGAASYHLVTHLKNGRSVYSFCMCPGGHVVAATSENGAVVTNGMSLHARDANNSNAALLVSVTPSDFGNSPLLGLEFQQTYERLAFEIAGNFRAPAVRMEDFLHGKESNSLGDVTPSYPRGVVLEGLTKCLPPFAVESLKAAIPDFDNYKKGFYLPDAVLTGVETRTTSPIRLLRGEDGQSIKGLYPCGEGAGYAGGIISSALDGLMTAKKLLQKYQTET